jgi:hypothetical protein
MYFGPMTFTLSTTMDHDTIGRLSRRWRHHTIDALNTQSLNHDLGSII